MQRNASQRSSEGSENTSVTVHSHALTFAKVLDGRKQPVRGLWQRGARFYPQLSAEDFSTGQKRVRRVPLMNSDGNAVETVAQAIAELNRLRTQRSDDALPIHNGSFRHRSAATRIFTRRLFGNRWNSPALTPNSGMLASMT